MPIVVRIVEVKISFRFGNRTAPPFRTIGSGKAGKDYEGLQMRPAPRIDRITERNPVGQSDGPEAGVTRELSFDVGLTRPCQPAPKAGRRVIVKLEDPVRWQKAFPFPNSRRQIRPTSIREVPPAPGLRRHLSLTAKRYPEWWFLHREHWALRMWPRCPA